MTLKPIPLEPVPKSAKEKQKFRPRKTAVKNEKDGFLKSICFGLIGYINKGGTFTYRQLDELIMSLERAVLFLRRKKEELLRRKWHGE